MSLTAEDRKTDLVDRVAAEARTRVGADKAESAEQFIRRYFALVAPGDIIYSSFETLLGGALSLWGGSEDSKNCLLHLRNWRLFTRRPCYRFGVKDLQ